MLTILIYKPTHWLSNGRMFVQHLINSVNFARLDSYSDCLPGPCDSGAVLGHVCFEILFAMKGSWLHCLAVRGHHAGAPVINV